MSVAWPGSLPQSPLVAGYLDTPPVTSTRTDMDAGIPKVRQRTSAKERIVQWPLILTTAQKSTLDDFWTTDTKGGSIRVTGLTRPGEVSSEDCRIRSRPQFTPVSGAIWRTVLDLEFLPT